VCEGLSITLSPSFFYNKQKLNAMCKNGLVQIDKLYYLEIRTEANRTSYFFQGANLLQDKVITGIEFIDPTNVTQSPNGQQPLALPNLSSASMNLKSICGTDNFINNASVKPFINLDTSRTILKSIRERIVNWDSSFLNIPAGALVADRAIMINIYYRELLSSEKREQFLQPL
jgi:hypothetical protein